MGNNRYQWSDNEEIRQYVKDPLNDYLAQILPQYVLAPDIDLAALCENMSDEMTDILYNKLEFDSTETIIKNDIKYVLYDKKRSEVTSAELHDGELYVHLKQQDGNRVAVKILELVNNTDWSVYHDYFKNKIESWSVSFSELLHSELDGNTITPTSIRNQELAAYLEDYFIKVFDVDTRSK